MRGGPAAADRLQPEAEECPAEYEPEDDEQEERPDSLLGDVAGQGRVAEIREEMELVPRDGVTLRRELGAQVLRLADVEREPEDERARAERGDERGNPDDRREERVEETDADRCEERDQDRQVHGHRVRDPEHGHDVRAETVDVCEREIDLSGDDHERQAEPHDRDRAEAPHDAEQVVDLEHLAVRANREVAAHDQDRERDATEARHRGARPVEAAGRPACARLRGGGFGH